MPDFTIQRDHSLGIDGARQLARHWAHHARRQHEMDCRIRAEDDCERVAFERTGVRGELIATADRFKLTVTLGFLLSGFSDRIRSEIEKNLDAAIAKATAASGGDAGAAKGELS
ncbi:MAG: polyhydroxyalkanoic acid synthase [Burkholderiales bacterium PBB1]|nr:MAG: polyhydroxyalkanoic acid synthase [Burkholderiales bacterium PBB1]